MHKDTAADLGIALAGCVVAVAVSSARMSTDGASYAAVLAMAVVAGASIGMIRRGGAALIALVGVVLSVLLAVTAYLVPYPANAPQVLLLITLAVLAHRGPWRLWVPVGAAGLAATAVNLAEQAGTARGVWPIVPVLLTGFPMLAGLALRPDLPRDGAARRILLDLLLAGCGVTFMLFDASSWLQEPGTGAAGWLVVAGGATAGLVRRLPGPALALQAALLVLMDVLTPPAADSMQVMPLVTLGVFAMGASWPWTAAAYALTTGVTALSVVNRSWPEVTVSRVAALLVMVAAPIAIGRYAAARRSAAQMRAAMAEEARRLSEARLRADRLAERERIARDVHDIVAHHVGAMVLRASAARYAGASGPVGEAFSDIRATGHQALQDLRGLLDVLRDPGTLGHLPVAEPGDVVADVVMDAVERMNAAGLSVELRMDSGVERTPLVARASAARIVQEGLTNVLKHAGPGASASVGLSVSGGALRVEVLSAPGPDGHADDAVTALPSSGRGVAGMRERARALGGDLFSGPDDSGGWRLAATLPLPEGRSQEPREGGRLAPHHEGEA
ncbi:histidine kinase [Sphaerisporangium sp. NPDC051011]|uniref:sensor histidine kinase n=1 Tax=Sphaerisporangium sp. NPDC051011 TaxID=3155792 RepID=UPI0033D09F8F